MQTGKIMHAMNSDLEQMAAVEAASYPKAEGASLESIRSRVEVFPDCFWVMKEDDKIMGFINGMMTKERDLRDEMYENAKMHDPNGRWFMIFSVVTAPDCRKRGVASTLMEQVILDVKSRLELREQGAGYKEKTEQDGNTEQKEKEASGIVLTCKERLLPFYSRFGFVNEGISTSTHGDVVWYQMRLTF